MGKNKRGKKANKGIELPFVSVCTPTYNRRPFIEQMIRCFDHQDYPKDKLEWIIIDDSSDDSSSEIVEKIANDYSWIKILKTKIPGKRGRGERIV